MLRERAARVLHGDRVTILSGYTRRLLSPPLPGDGLLVVGFVEGVVGWSLSWLLVSSGLSFGPLGLVESLVALWVVLTALIVTVGAVYTAPTVRRSRIWFAWAVLNASAVVVNIAAVTGFFPGPLADLPLVTEYLGFGYWQPWFFVLGVGYLATGLYNWSSPQLRKTERVVYALGGVACFAILAPWPLDLPLYGARLFLVGGLLHTVPMGFDILSDVALILRRTS